MNDADRSKDIIDFIEQLPGRSVFTAEPAA
jgi:hypothetical protein